MEFRLELSAVAPGVTALGDAFAQDVRRRFGGLDTGLVLSVDEGDDEVVASLSLDEPSLMAACDAAAEALNAGLASVGLGPVEWECQSGGAPIEEPG